MKEKKATEKIGFSSQIVEDNWGLFISLICFLLALLLGLLCLLIFEEEIYSFQQPPKYDKTELEKKARKRSLLLAMDTERVENGIHVSTGMVYDKNFQTVRAACTACHSPKLITQNRATREGWKEMIVWMQATQGLGDLGENERPILDYLSKHYAPKEIGRRKNLDIAEIEWFILELD